jgi:glycosyltransferase involved in cell wall biosynthesis
LAPSASQIEGSPVLSIVIPAFNEAASIERTLRELRNYVDRLGLAWELIVVDDGSSDRTNAIVEQAAAGDRRIRLIRGGRGGKGKAIQRGMLEARGAWRFMADADLAMPPDNLDRFLDAVGVPPAPHIVIGSREAPGSRRVGEHWLRHLIGRVFNAHVRLFALPGITDTQCGFKLFSAGAAEALFPRLTISGFAFDVELLMLARRAGFDVREVGIVWHGRADSRVAVSRGAAAFGDVLRVRWNAWAGRYGPKFRTSRPPSPPEIRRSSSSSPSSTATVPSPRSGTAASAPSAAPTRD